MPIKVWDYRQEYEAERVELWDAMKSVFDSGRLILGQNVADFEAEFAAYCGVPHGVGVDNGTNAIWLGLLAVGVEPGAEVITVANTAVPTVAAIVTMGAVPRFVDIDPDTYLMDTAALEGAITPKTACILPVHLYGQCVNMAEVSRVAGAHGLKVVEDCAQAHGAAFDGRKAGSMSDAAAFSFYPTKVLGGYGDGGMVLTRSDAVDTELRRLRMYGMDGTYYAQEHGYNARLDELHAAILRSKLTRLDDYIARRRQLASRYDELLADTGLKLPTVAVGNDHAYYLYVVRHRDREEIIVKLRERDIIVNVSYPWPIHIMTAYRSPGHPEGSLPETEAAARETFSLPMYPSLTDEQQLSVCDALHDILGKL